MDGVHAPLTTAIILLLAGVVAIILMRRFSLSPIVGYLAAGIIIGPHAFGLVQESETTHLLAELGVVFLLFDIGLHFSLSSIWEARRDIFGLGPLQLLLCGIAFGLGFITIGIGTEYALLLGGALALSSTAVVVPILVERGQRNCPVGLTAVAILIFQDIFAIFLLVFAASLESGSGPFMTGLAVAIVVALGKTAFAFLATLLLGKYAIKPLFKLLSQSRNEEVFTAMALLIVLATATATSGVALSLTLGAFLGGIIIAETPYRHVIQTEAKPFRNLLLGFFFISVGMSLDWHLLLENLPEIFTFAAAFVAVKIIIFSFAARTAGWSTRGSVQLGFLLSQGSEFVFVILAMPSLHSALGDSTFGIVITGVAATLAISPGLATIGNRVARMIDRHSAVSIPSSETTAVTTTAPIILFGMGEVGRTVADALEANGIAYDAIDGDHERFLSASADGYPVAFGEVGDHRLMETLAYGERALIVITSGNLELAQSLTPTMHERYPGLTCIVAVEHDKEKHHLEALGLRVVINRSLPPGLDTAVATLHFLQVSEEKILSWMRRQQERSLQATYTGSTTMDERAA